MKKKLKLKEKKILQGLIVFFSLIVITLSLVGDKGFLQLMALKNQEKILLKEIEDLESEKKEWINKIHSLKTNETYIETIAREKLGMIKHDEFLIK
ncbi:septum formation initiator family protein, partial [bacterium]|nr:septum formation initiator family protein [bacterium]